jgi:GAF domain-containing protein
MCENTIQPIDFSKISETYRQAIDKVLHNIHMRRYSVLIGPHFSGKSSLLKTVFQKLQNEGRVCLIINMENFDYPTLAQFYCELAKYIKRTLNNDNDLSVDFCKDIDSGQTFGDFLIELLEINRQSITLLFDQFESIPDDFHVPFLLTLRKVYNQQSHPERVLVAIASSLSLASLTLGPNSPFNIAETIALGNLAVADEYAIIDVIMDTAGVQISANARQTLQAETNGDTKLIYSICELCFDRVSNTNKPKINIRQVNNAVSLFMEDYVYEHSPLIEALRVVENDAELLDAMLLLLSKGEVSRQELFLTPSADLDKLYLTGLVLPTSQGKYRLRNKIYSKFLNQYYSPDKLSQLLSRLQEWDKAIDRLEQLVCKDRKLREHLLDVVIRAMNAATNVNQAAHYFQRGLSAGFEVSNINLWRVDPRKPTKRYPAQLIKVPTNHKINDLSTDTLLLLEKDCIETQAIKENRITRSADGEKRAIPLQANENVFGVITFTDDPLVSTHHQDEMPTFLKQAALALRAALNNQIKLSPPKSRARQEDRNMLLLMQQATSLIQTLPDIERSLHLIMTIITAHFGLGFNRAWLFLVNANKTAFTGRIAIGDFTDKDARSTWRKIKKFSFDEYVRKIKSSAEIDKTPLDIATRGFKIPLDSDGHDIFSHAVIKPSYYQLNADASYFLPPVFKENFGVDDAYIVPLIAGGDCKGLIITDNRFTSYKIPDAEMLLAFCNLAAAAIMNDRQRTEESQRSVLAETLSDISQQLTRTLAQKDILQSVLKQMNRLKKLGLLPFDKASIQLYKEQEKALCIVESIGFKDSGAVNKLKFPIDGDYPNIRVHKFQASLIFPDIQKEYKHFSSPRYYVENIKGWMGVPLRVGENVIGVITLDSSQSDTYNNQHRRIASIFANITATALENARLYEQQKLLNKDLSGLNRTALDLATHLVSEEPNFLQSLVDSVCKLTDVDSAIIYPLQATEDPEYDLDHITHSGLLYPESFVSDNSDFHTPNNPNRLVLDKKNLFVENINSYSKINLFENEFIRREKIRSFIGISLELADKAPAILYVYFRKFRIFDDETTKFFIEFIKLVGLMLLTSTNLNDKNEELTRTIDMMKRVEEIDKMISSTLELNPILTQILIGAFALTKAEFGRVILLNPKNPAEFNEEYRLSKKTSSTDSSLAKEISYEFNPEKNALPKVALSSGMRSKIVALLLVENQTNGFIQIESPEENAFSTEDQKLLGWLAIDAALAINNAQRYKELKQTQYEATFHLHMALIGLWSADFKHDFDQYILGLRSWLFEIKTNVDKDSVDKDKIHEYLKEIEDILRITQQMPFSEGYPIIDLDKSNKVISKQAIRLNAALREIVVEICNKHLDINVLWELNHADFLIPISLRNFQVIVEKVVHNALKAMNLNGTLTIWSRETSNKYIEVHFKDTGHGIPKEKQKDFLKLPMGQSDNKSGGYGGLIARFIARIYNGDLFLVQSEENEGTEICLKLPAIDK